MVVSLDLPRAILTGGGSVSRLGGLLANFGMRRPLVVADSFLASPQSGAVDKVVAAMSTSVADYGVFTDTISDPTTESVERCVDALAAGSYDSIVALGGGSPMDTAKAAAALRTHGGRMRDYKAPFTLDKPSLPIVAIPTTAGTGSEATKFTIITDSETEEKMLCIGRAVLKAEDAFLYPNQRSRADASLTCIQPYSAAFAALTDRALTRCSEDAAQHRLPAPRLAYSRGPETARQHSDSQTRNTGSLGRRANPSHVPTPVGSPTSRSPQSSTTSSGREV